jgi:asparagine synthetase B (glutamine-hydrolysing)
MLSLLGDQAVDCSPEERPRVHLGVWLPARPSPAAGAVARDGDVAVLFSGYLRDPAASFGGEARFVLENYRAKDWSWLREANGVFAFAVVDWREDRCVLAVDRLGIRPLFFVHDECGVAFAEDLGLLSCTREKPVEFDQVFEERSLTEDDPERYLTRRVTEEVYPQHPYGRPILGTRDLMQKPKRDELAAYYRKHYVPRNMVLVVIASGR